MVLLEQTSLAEPLEAFTVSGQGGLMHVFTTDDLQNAVMQQLFEDTFFRIMVYRTSYSDTRVGEGIYLVVDEKTLIVEEFGVCIGMVARLLPEFALIPKQPFPSTILLFSNKAERAVAKKHLNEVAPPRDEMEEERRCRLLKAFPLLGDYDIIAIFVELLDECVTELQREGRTVTAKVITEQTHFSEELATAYLDMLKDQHARLQR